MTIRRATSKDKEAVFSLLNELKISGYAEMGVTYEPITPSPQAHQLFDELLQDPSTHFILAETDGLVVGLLLAYEIPKLLEGNHRILIEEIVIDPQYRHQGIGTQLIKEIESIALDRSIDTIKVTTGTRLKANQFYQKLGYIHFENAYRKKLT